MCMIAVPFPKPASPPPVAEDPLAYFVADLPRVAKLRSLSVIDLMYGYYREE